MNTKEFITKFDNNERFTEKELSDIAYHGMDGDDYNFIKTEEGKDLRWERPMTEIFQVNDRYFAIPWMKGLTEYQEDFFDNQPYEVKPIKKMIEVTEWKAI